MTRPGPTKWDPAHVQQHCYAVKILFLPGPGPRLPECVACVRACACRGLETQVLRAEYWSPETRDPKTQCPFIEALKLRSWEPNAATRQQQKKGASSVCLSPETQLSLLLIGLAWLLKLGFLGRYQYIKKRVLGFKFLGFLGDGFGTGGLCPTITGTH
jgi:hypothetical protein